MFSIGIQIYKVKASIVYLQNLVRIHSKDRINKRERSHSRHICFSFTLIIHRNQTKGALHQTLKVHKTALLPTRAAILPFSTVLTYAKKSNLQGNYSILKVCLPESEKIINFLPRLPRLSSLQNNGNDKSGSV